MHAVPAEMHATPAAFHEQDSLGINFDGEGFDGEGLEAPDDDFVFPENPSDAADVSWKR